MLSLDIATTFRSILLPGQARAARMAEEDALHDLALDQVLSRMTENAPAAAEAFRTLCADTDQVVYRQEVFRALEREDLRGIVDRFLDRMARAGRYDTASATSRYRYEPELWHLSAVGCYVDAVTTLSGDLVREDAVRGAEGLRALSDYLVAFCATPEFAALAAEAEACRKLVDGLRYNILVRGARVTVADVDGEEDLRAEVLATFARFRTADGPPVSADAYDPGLDHVQAWVLEKVAQVHPAEFARLVRFAQTSRDYRDPTVDRFAGEVWFYLAVLDHLAPLRRAGLPVCYPVVSAESKDLDVRDTFDLALATRIVAGGGTVVPNDLRLTGGERILVVSGPNQGGKSTAARTFGQLHHLAAIGCPVPGSSARVFLCDQVLTEFEREEQLDDLEGRLGAEIVRMHGILESATGRTVLVLNEVFSSTALQDARTLTRDVLERILALDALAVCVTFIDELSRLDERTVSMVSAVDPHDPAVRTFRVERRVADGRAYARALAAVHGLTGEQIARRLAARREGEGDVR